MGFIASAYTGLHTLLNGNAVFASYGSALKVFFGPPAGVDRAKEIEIWVGSAGQDEIAGNRPGTFSQRWATMGATGAQRDKTLVIPCSIWVIGGSTDMAARLARAEGVYTLIDTLVKTADLGMGTVLCGGVEVSSAEIELRPGPDGAEVLMPFAVQVSGRE